MGTDAGREPEHGGGGHPRMAGAVLMVGVVVFLVVVALLGAIGR